VGGQPASRPEGRAVADRLRLNRVLVLNSGSSSLKWSVLDAASEAVVGEGNATWEGAEPGRHEAEIAAALRNAPDVDAVGHRVVHGGSRLRHAVSVDESLRDGIAELASLAPMHNPAALAGIEAATRRYPDVPQVAAFDTAFHATIPDAAALYPLPWEWTQAWGLRRFGFHGLSVQYAVRRTTEMLGQLPPRLVVAHLGSGCSISAVAEGRSVDTSMGFTPLEGLMMGRRSGSVDPGLLVHLLTQGRLDVAALDSGLNEASGLLGVSGVSGDMRKVQAAADQGNERASLAIEMFVHRVVATVGGLAAVLGGLDALVFTGGIGEHSPRIRAAVASRLGHLGLAVDADANAHAETDADVTTAGSHASILVITAREDLAVLTEIKRVLSGIHPA
jgi:acetate kinase